MAGVVEPIILAAVGWVASPLVKMLLDEGFASLGIDAEKKLEEMEETVLPVLESVIEKAEDSAQDSAPRRKVGRWLQRLRDAYDDAEDALDLLHYDRLRRKAAAAARSSKRRSNYPVRSSSFHIPKHVKWVIPVLKGGRDMLSPQKIKLKRSLNKLEKIAREAEKLPTSLGAQPDQTAAAAPDRSRETTSLPPHKVFGRKKDRGEIIRLLKTEPAAGVRIPILAIVGRPGVGKTTLAKYVCQKLRSELDDSRHFDPIMWVYASRKFGEFEIMKEIIQRASTASEPQEDLGNLKTLEALQLKIREKLKEKKFLLVIDDVWWQGNNWDTLFICLCECCLPGSKILVTSQTDDAPGKIFGRDGAAALEHIRQLEDLEKDDFEDLFIHYALSSLEFDSHLGEDLKEKCKTIAAKLNKDPTAAKMVGETIATKLDRLLRSQGDWRTYLDTIAQKDWSGDKTNALMWSYRHLPAHLQRCFSYCSLYPKGCEFKALKLVQLWMAQGFIKPDDQNERVEDVGNDYLEKLVSRFYIQSHGNYYTLHELLYNLATKVSSSVCLRVEGKKEKIPSTIRHLCIPADKLNENEEEICKLKKLRTLIVTKGESDVSDENVAIDVSNSLKKFSLKKFSLKKLRVLVLKLNLENLAKFMSGMKHLRILRVSGTREFVLPESVSTLYQLQVLKVENASSLPKFLSNLVSLRYLQPSGIADIGKLTSLQRLEEFEVRKEKGYELEQLQKLNELRGSLHIFNLENVESKESAVAANLKEKKHIDRLRLYWFDGDVNSNLNAEILAGLQLPPNLTALHLSGYRGRSWPSWPENQIGNIETLSLWECKMLEELPPMDQLFPYCRSLDLWHLSRLEALPTLPPRLQVFRIIDAPFLTFVTKEDLQMSPADKISIIKVMRERMPKWFPHQYKRDLVRNEREMRNFIAATNGSDSNEASSREHSKSVPAADADITAVQERWLEVHERKTESIYSRRNEAELLLPSTLTGLWLDRCNITNRALSACLQTLISLTLLSLEDLKMITCLPSLANLKALHTLRLIECWALTSLVGIGSLPCLRALYLIGCPCLDIQTAVLPPSLQSFTFNSCADADVILANANLPHLSDLNIIQCHTQTASLQFRNIRSLHSLTIMDCSGLSSLVDLQELHFLEFLILENCPKLQSVTNLPRSLKRLVVHKCPLLEEGSVNTDPISGVRMLDGIPVDDKYRRRIHRTS